MTRTATLHFTSDDTHARTIETVGKSFDTMIGRFMLWNLDGYPIVRIYRDVGSETDFTACYHKTEDSLPGYAIGAVWNGEAYGFHS